MIFVGVIHIRNLRFVVELSGTNVNPILQPYWDIKLTCVAALLGFVVILNDDLSVVTTTFHTRCPIAWVFSKDVLQSFLNLLVGTTVNLFQCAEIDFSLSRCPPFTCRSFTCRLRRWSLNNAKPALEVGVEPVPCCNLLFFGLLDEC